jgi:hypothetical protein
LTYFKIAPEAQPPEFVSTHARRFLPALATAKPLTSLNFCGWLSVSVKYNRNPIDSLG